MRCHHKLRWLSYFNTKKLIDSLERIAVLADQQSSVVKFKLDDTDLASISADAQDIGNANESIPVLNSGENFDMHLMLDIFWRV